MNTYQQQPAQRYRLKSNSEIWFEGLSFKNQEVIKFFSNAFGRGMARERSYIVQDFYKERCDDRPPVDVPLSDKYEYAYDNFEDFKLYAHERMVPVPAEGGAL